MKDIVNISPMEIEKESFAIISRELGRELPPEQAPIVKRVIHTTADFDYAENLYFSPGAVELAKEAVKSGAHIVTDTQMALAGINKRAAARFGCRLSCYMSDPDVAERAGALGLTRARISMDKALENGGEIFAVGNAPTALIRLRELIDMGRLEPKLIIGVPVGFVNVVRSKELIIESGVPCIVAKGRKGGSAIAACIVNALLYELDERRGQ